MLPRSFYTFLAVLGAVTAAAGTKGHRDPRSHAFANNYGSKKVLIGGGPSGTISIADFNGTDFKIVANNTMAGTSPSWLLFKRPNLLYAVDENSDTIQLFHVSWSCLHPPRQGDRKGGMAW